MTTISFEVVHSLCREIYASKAASSTGRIATSRVDSFASAGSCFERNPKNERLQSLAHIITSIAAPRTTDKRSFRSQCERAYSDYTKVSEFNQQIGPSVFSELRGEQEGVDFLLGGEGLCVAQVMEHLSQVFRGVESFEADFPIQELEVDGLSMRFKRFVSDKEGLIEIFSKKNSLRFHQAVYKMESAYRRVLLRRDRNRGLAIPFHQYIPDSILRTKGFKLEGCIPKARSDGTPISFEFREIIPSLTACATPDKVFLLGVSSISLGGQHAIALSLKEPIHFLDPMYGMGFAETRDDLFLFLANFLALKYGHNMTFSLLEFSSRSPVAA